MTDKLPTHRERLIEHFASFSASERDAFATLYGASNATPTALAEQFLKHTSVVRAVLAHELPDDSDALRLVEDLAYDHDMYVDISWSGRGPRRRLFDLGLVARPERGQPVHQLEMVGAIAGVVAPLLPGFPTTALTLLATREEAYINRVAAAWKITAPSPLERVLVIAEELAAPERVDDLVDILGADYLGAALMALELGGVCFWQEVFGYDLDENPEFGDNVVPLMRGNEREFERHIADTLLDHGVLFRVESDGRSPLAVVPEELWPTLWETGRAWMMEWIWSRFEDLRASAARRGVVEVRDELQPSLKWLTCEIDRGRLRHDKDNVASAETLRHLVAVGGNDEAHWQGRLRLGMELNALHGRGETFTAEPAYEHTIDLPRSGFARDALLDWCVGYVGFDCDAMLAQAVGLDDVWRAEALNMLVGRTEFVPRWLLHEGIDPNTTGSGQIRNPGESTEDQLEVEVALTNGMIWSAKLVWMDLLSLLESQMWYSRTLLVDLLQLAAGFAVFGQLFRALEDPGLGLYLPVQRASLLVDDYSAPAFDPWFDDIIAKLFVPLGVAVADGEAIWLDTASLRIDTPPGMLDEDRQNILRAIFDKPDFEFELARPRMSALLRAEHDDADDASISADAPLDELRDWLDGREIRRFDGRRIHV